MIKVQFLLVKNILNSCLIFRVCPNRRPLEVMAVMTWYSLGPSRDVSMTKRSVRTRDLGHLHRMHWSRLCQRCILLDPPGNISNSGYNIKKGFMAYSFYLIEYQTTSSNFPLYLTKALYLHDNTLLGLLKNI